MLVEVIGTIFGSFAPVHVELALEGVVFNPVESNVHGLGGSMLYSVFDNYGCVLVVILNRSGYLGMAHLFLYYMKICIFHRIKK